MKEIIAVFLAVLLLFTLCACASDEATEDQNNANNIIIEDTGKNTPSEQNSANNVIVEATSKNTPSEQMILEDLKEALQRENEFATLAGIETVKSLTNEGTYEITLAVTAETKYADWQYEANMSYTKYDQGWIVDDVDWINSSYEQVRLPDVDTMSAYASSYLLAHEVYSDVWFTDYMIPMIDPSLEFGFHNETNSDVLQLSWSAVEDNGFYLSSYCFTTLWQYDCEIDNWELVPDNTHGSLGYYVSEILVEKMPKEEISLNGQWDNGYIQFDISNFTWNDFDVRIPGYIDSPEHFTLVTNTEDADILPPQNVMQAVCDIAFKNGEGNYITFKFSDNYLEIYYFDGSCTYNGCPWYTVTLPISRRSLPT